MEVDILEATKLLKSGSHVAAPQGSVKNSYLKGFDQAIQPEPVPATVPKPLPKPEVKPVAKASTKKTK
jgi:hypothetical protein